MKLLRALGAELGELVDAVRQVRTATGSRAEVHVGAVTAADVLAATSGGRGFLQAGPVDRSPEYHSVPSIDDEDVAKFEPAAPWSQKPEKQRSATGKLDSLRGRR